MAEIDPQAALSLWEVGAPVVFERQPKRFEQPVSLTLVGSIKTTLGHENQYALQPLLVDEGADNHLAAQALRHQRRQ